MREPVRVGRLRAAWALWLARRDTYPARHLKGHAA
ncbi:hypothetical protein FHU30_004568 [Actinomadura rupiterrae]|nr:hypothetical protein [Actinomadura rupiterrae]